MFSEFYNRDFLRLEELCIDLEKVMDEVILADSFYVFLIFVLLILYSLKEKRKSDNNLCNSKYLYYMK